ncbi:hypothetical protein K2173_022019 [Erythroxylum novogranatense]|uniref:DYW domain-containing protein n=1 Tax=Erythroxylum novogranatense TaxID=1862640 RepID=A0AAV8T3M0_9ROSI|nr:hypothetical protein K2173_022019 [Erythroxylum novogranatense]
MRSPLRYVSKHQMVYTIGSSTSLKELKQIHTHLLVNGHLNDSNFSGQFVAAIALNNHKNINYSEKVLDQWETPTMFCLNSMIRAHSKSSTPERSFLYYNKILRSSDHISPDNYTFNFLVRACTQHLTRWSGPTVHGLVIKHGFECDPHVLCGLIRMYAELGGLDSCFRMFGLVRNPDLVCQTAMISACAKCGDFGSARELFDAMSQRDTWAFNAMISGYAQCGQSKEALRLFRMMQLEEVKIDDVCMVSVLSACSHLGASDHGRWAHAYIERHKIPMTVTLGTALIDMYAKCGNISKAMEVFWGMKEKNVYTWTCAMNGLAMNGAGHKCLELFSLMKENGISPNGVSFVSILRACSVVGLIEEGHEQFVSMKRVYGIEPLAEHYGCMVDLYARSGRLDDAVNIINNMPVTPHAGAWGALLNACKLHRDKELGELAARKLIQLEGSNHCAFVILSNIYSDSRDWARADNVRQTMNAKGIKKKPGCSVMEVDGEVHEFFVGDTSHPRYGDIKVKLEEIYSNLRLSGYVANTKPDSLYRHSEKVAIAFGLITVKQVVPIRIVKNLRICWDCHDLVKAVSKIYNKEIIVRDRNRFHHFEDGHCSCSGYW